MPILAKLKFWFDLGRGALEAAILSVLLLSNQDKIFARINEAFGLHLSGSLWEGLGLIALAVLCVVCFGICLDKFRFEQFCNRERNARNEAISEIRRRVE